jgi:hypothetical protein
MKITVNKKTQKQVHIITVGVSKGYYRDGESIITKEETEVKDMIDKQRVKEVLKKHLTAEYAGAVVVDKEYYDIIKELGLE